MSADKFVLATIRKGAPDFNSGVAWDVQEYLDEGMLSASVAAKASAWLKNRPSTRSRAGGEGYRRAKKVLYRARGRSSRSSSGRGKGKRGWIKRDGRWIATR